ncbi:MAG: molybdopterin molybdotransferase MoeA [Acidimicrobiales bacterium]
MIDLDEARTWVLSACRPLPMVRLPPAGALGLVLGEDVVAAEAVPPFANSSMDGYALKAADVACVPARLEVVGTLMAGDDPEGVSVEVGQAVRIMTGAALPGGADAVCMVEHTRSEDGWVVIEEAVRVSTNVRPPGDDIASGDLVFAAGARLGAAHVAVLASLGVGEVVAHRRPRASVMSTGDELVSDGRPLGAGKIRDSNRPGLLAQLGADGFEPVDLGWVADEPGTLAAALEGAAEACDAVLTSGGVSVGDRDVVRAVLEKLGGERARWMQVAVKPAKPFAFSLLGPRATPVFGLPGNPVSAMVSYELFARPALRLMAGHRCLGRPELRATAGVDLPRRPDGKLHLARVVLSTGPAGEVLAKPSGGQGSHQMLSLAGANALALLPDGHGVSAGGPLRVWLLDTDVLAGAGASRAPWSPPGS